MLRAYWIGWKQQLALSSSSDKMTGPIRSKPEPWCPECGAMMVLRRPKSYQDWNAFWGCPGYPDCEGTRNIDEDGLPIYYEREERDE